MRRDALVLSYNNKISSQHVRELILDVVRNKGSIYTIATSQLIIKECLALGTIPLIVPRVGDVTSKDLPVYIFYKGTSQTVLDYKETVEKLGGQCTIIDKF